MTQLQQIPEVAVQVLEHRHRTVRFDLRLAAELHADRDHAVVVTPEVVGIEKEEDATAGLVADRVFLLRVRRSREQQRWPTRARRRNAHPALVLLDRKSTRLNSSNIVIAY